MQKQNIIKYNYKNFIKSSNQLKQSDYICGICYEFCIRPMQCSGPCKKIFCMKCLSQWLMKNGKCPFKCTKGKFQTYKIPNISLQFNCPYNSQQCKQAIKSVKQFQNHFKYCKYINPQQLKVETYKDQYKCLHGHQLQFFIGSYQEMCKSVCASCNDQKLVRSKCRICDQLYCVQCRAPTCSKKGCPIGHPFKYLQINNPSYICDICGVSIVLAGKGVRDDSQCNFGICDQCYEQLPQKIQFNKIIQSKDNQCDKSHILKFIQMNHLQSKNKTCFACRKNKFCPKYCQQCNKFYCLKCKNIEISQKGKCYKGHSFIKKQFKDESNLQNASPQQDILVKMCNYCNQSKKQTKWMIIDEECKIQLCQRCFEYLIARKADKQRFFTDLKCKNDHSLRYINIQFIMLLNCSQCEEYKQIRLLCPICTKQSEKLFCSKCRQPPAGMCYVGHPLNPNQSVNKCIICQQVKQGSILSCTQCFFNVCLNCQDNLYQKQKQKKSKMNQIDNN